MAAAPVSPPAPSGQTPPVADAACSPPVAGEPVPAVSLSATAVKPAPPPPPPDAAQAEPVVPIGDAGDVNGVVTAPTPEDGRASPPEAATCPHATTLRRLPPRSPPPPTRRSLSLSRRRRPNSPNRRRRTGTRRRRPRPRPPRPKRMTLTTPRPLPPPLSTRPGTSSRRPLTSRSSGLRPGGGTAPPKRRRPARRQPRPPTRPLPPPPPPTRTRWASCGAPSPGTAPGLPRCCRLKQPQRTPASPRQTTRPTRFL